MTTNIALIGLDGATWYLLREWLEEGTLPNLQRVYDSGFTGTLKSTIPPNTSPAVQSLYTGCDPATLGVFGFQKPDGTTISLRDIHVPKIWSVLGQQNLSSCVVNVRTTFPPDQLNGVMLSGDPMPGEESAYAYPPEVKEQVSGFRCEEKDERMHKELVPPYEHNREVLQHAVDIFEHRWETFRELSETEDYDFLMYWIGETDFLQHRLWENPDDIREFYEVVDEKMGDFLDSFEGSVIFLSDHGFEGPPSTVFYANEWLRREGYLKAFGGSVGARLLGSGQAFAKKHVNKEYLMEILYFLQQRSANSENGGSTTTGSVGINKPHLQIPGIRSHSKARLASNCSIEVTALEHRRDIADEIKTELIALEDDDGRPVMKEVLRRDEIYTEGPYFEDIPDLLFQASEHITVKPEFSKSIFKRLEPSDQSGRGRHEYARKGVIFGTGPDIEPAKDIEVNITDVAPTILHLFGLPVADTMTGSVIRDICRDAGANVSVKKYAEGSSMTEIAEEEQAEMEEWLEDMGYI